MATGLEARDKSFFLDGKKVTLLSGALHYFRVVPDYWRDRLTRFRACGLNCVETYVPWNLHEETRGVFNFSGILDLRRFIQEAREVGLHVLLRPGPYICAEWDFGGLPSWLLHDPEMKVRSAYPPYLAAVDRYFAKLLPLVADLQHSSGGPIIAVQIENEYGSYGDNAEYQTFLKETLVKYGITELLFTSDNGMGIQKGKIPGVLMTANFQELEHGYLMFEYLKNVVQPTMPLMVMEFWTGWFDHWGDKHSIWPVQKFEKVLRWILEQGSSVNFYMFHGGTNFGFMNGANEGLGATNEGGNEPYAPVVTSYDYDAPVLENGDLGPKFFKTKELLLQFAADSVGTDVPEVPPPIPSTDYGELAVTGHLTLEEVIAMVKPVHSKDLVAMETLNINNDGGQGYGFILYRKQIANGSILHIHGKVRDRAQILVNQQEVGIVEWTMDNYQTQLSLTDDNQLDILVENLGRVNFADFQSPILNQQRKGLIGDVLLDDQKLQDWQVYPLELKPDFIERASECDHWHDGLPPSGSPALLKVTLKIEGQPKDTYVNMKGWSKGVVFVNGFNLGRYSEQGPQETLYLPAPLLRQGHNELVILELHKPSSCLALEARPQHGETVIHNVVLPMWVNAAIFGLRNVLKLGGWVWPMLRFFVK